MRRVVLALCLAGCVQSLPVGAERPPRSSDLVVVDAVSAAFRAAGNPWTARCRQERRSRMVVVRNPEGVSVYCASRGPCCGTMEKQDACRCSLRTGGAGCAAGATTWEGDIVAPFAALSDTYRVVFWVSPFEDDQTQARLIAHEAVHWMLTCSEVGDDRTHADPRWWGASGIESAGW